MNLQHVNAKLLLNNAGAADLEAVIPVFHGWIQERSCEEQLIDVADYRHVPAGPGVVLIGHEANYSLDNSGNRLGVRYNRKGVLNDNSKDRLEQATRAAIEAMRRLENDPRLLGKIRFNGRQLQLFVNDRLLAPSNNATREAIEPEIHALCARLFRGRNFSLEYEDDSRRLFSATVTSEDAFTTAELLANLEL